MIHSVENQTESNGSVLIRSQYLKEHKEYGLQNRFNHEHSDSYYHPMKTRYFQNHHTEEDETTNTQKDHIRFQRYKFKQPITSFGIILVTLC